MSYMEARAEMPWENNSQSPIPWAQRVANLVHLQLAFLPAWDLNPQDAEEKYRRLTHWATQEGFILLVILFWKRHDFPNQERVKYVFCIQQSHVLQDLPKARRAWLITFVYQELLEKIFF